jgi:hypothetical protein
VFGFARLKQVLMRGPIARRRVCVGQTKKDSYVYLAVKYKGILVRKKKSRLFGVLLARLKEKMEAQVRFEDAKRKPFVVTACLGETAISPAAPCICMNSFDKNKNHSVSLRLAFSIG